MEVFALTLLVAARIPLLALVFRDALDFVLGLALGRRELIEEVWHNASAERAAFPSSSRLRSNLVQTVPAPYSAFHGEGSLG
jgi:hypothetical protein